MVTARAVTDESGYTVSGFSSAAYRTSNVSLNDTRAWKREPDKPYQDVNNIGTLVNSPAYNLLATYLVNKLGLSLHKMVHNGRKGQVKWIAIDGRTYWSRGYVIHDRY